MKVAIIGPPFDVPGLKHSLKNIKEGTQEHLRD